MFGLRLLKASKPYRHTMTFEVLRCLSSFTSSTPSAMLQAKSFELMAKRSESHLAKLRKKTGYAFALCRKALEMHGQDLAEAEKWLRAEAAKQGWERAERVKSRVTGEGLIGIFTTPDHLQSSMVEVKCETDFVARNEHFVALVSELARKLCVYPVSAQQMDHTSTVNKVWIVDESKLDEIGGEAIRAAISKLGENIRFVRACVVRVPGGQGATLMPYTHAVAGRIQGNDSQVVLGKYGTIMVLNKGQSDQVEEHEDTTTVATTLEDLASRLGQHIIGLSPQTVVAPEDSKESSEDLEQLSELTGEEEPTALLKQRFILNDEITVEQFLRNSNAQVLDFVRFECGEELD